MLRSLNRPATQGQATGNAGRVTVCAGPFATVEPAARARQKYLVLGFSDVMVVGP
ncbi:MULTISPECIES: hypothetical protein [Tabrizicola]|uniref:hypothetical protein n=1 Tax=Tabrizicola TaxID=1443919 RepID=UPI001436722A|nr:MULTISPECIES: hypothetical protein [Paracoccaceae]